MKALKRIICTVLVIAILAGLTAGMALAAGTVAYGAGTVSASVLNIRSGPGTNYSVASTVKNGSTVVVLEKTTSAWYKINYNGTVGYVSSQYLTGVSTQKDFSGTGKVNDTGVRWRSTASTSGSVLGVIAKGTEVEIIGIDSGWYHLSYSGKTGYMRSDYITLSKIGSKAAEPAKTQETVKEEAPAAKTEEKKEEAKTETAEGTAAVVNANYVNFRTGPGTSYSVIRMLNSNTEVTVLEESSGWYKLSYNGTTGYMSSRYVTKKAAAANQPSVAETAVKQEKENKEAAEKAAAEQAAKEAAEKAAAEQAAKEAAEKAAKEAAEKAEAEKAAEKPDEERPAMVTGTYVNVRAGAGTDKTVIDCLKRGTRLTVLNEVNGWYKVKFNGTVGYMSADYVSLITEEESKKETVTQSKGEEIAAYAKQYSGYRYVYGGASPSTGFDCSGLVYYVYNHFGYSLPHGATSQYNKLTKYVNKADLQPGDLVFFSSNGFSSITHVGIYLGDGKFVHASGTNVGVIISDLNSSWYSAQYYGAKRVI